MQAKKRKSMISKPLSVETVAAPLAEPSDCAATYIRELMVTGARMSPKI